MIVRRFLCDFQNAEKSGHLHVRKDGTAADFQTERIQICIRNQQGMQYRGLESPNQLGKRS